MSCCHQPPRLEVLIARFSRLGPACVPGPPFWSGRAYGRLDLLITTLV